MSFTRAKEYATGSGLQPEHLEIYINDATICLSNLSKEMSAAKEKQSLDPVNEDISSHSSGYNSNDEKDQLSSRFTPFEKEVRPPQGILDISALYLFENAIVIYFLSFVRSFLFFSFLFISPPNTFLKIILHLRTYKSMRDHDNPVRS